MPKAPVKILRVLVTNVDDSVGGRAMLFFTSATEANAVFRRINKGNDDRFEEGAEALEPDILEVFTTKAGIVDFLNSYCSEL
jgi:hypothetical protein